MEKRADKVHFKMFKAGKFWLVSGIALTVLGSTAVLNTNVHADEISSTQVSANVGDSNHAVTPQNTNAVDDAQAAVDQDQDDIAKNQADTANEQNHHDELADQTAGKQQDVNNAQKDADTANDQVKNDQQTADDLKPDEYTDAQNAAKDAQQNANQAQNDVDQATANKNQAQHDADQAQKDADQAAKDRNAAAKAKADAQNKADAAKDKADNTPATTNVHHDPHPVKPGSQTKPSEINSDADLPTDLVEPDGLTDAEKNQDHYASSDPWYKYVGANDTSAVIKAGSHLTAAQQKELAEYALALINSFRAQHGLKPILMSDTVQQLGQAVIDLRVKDQTEAGVHTDTNSSDLDDAINRVAGGNQYDVISGGENLFDSILGSNDVTMLQLKVELLQQLTGMCFADGNWDWGHRDNFLSHTYGSSDEADQVYMSFNLQNYGDVYGTGFDTTAYLFDFWVARTGTNGEAEKALNNGLYTAYVNHGYDTTETNPAYTQAVNDYQNALNQLNQATKAYQQANYNYNNAQSGVKAANDNLAKASQALKDAQAKLQVAQNKLADAKQALANAAAKYADQLKAYQAALKTLKADQAKAAQLNQALADAKAALADHQQALADSEAKIQQLKDQLKELEAKLAQDEQALADAKNNADNGNSDNNSDNHDSDNNNSGDDADNNGSDDHSSDGNGSDSSHDSDNDSGNNDSDGHHDADNGNSDENGSNNDSATNNNSGHQDADHSHNSDSNAGNNDANSNAAGDNQNQGSDTSRSDADSDNANDSNQESGNAANGTVNQAGAPNSQNNAAVASTNQPSTSLDDTDYKSNVQPRLPQTDEQKQGQKMTLLGIVGIFLSSLGLVSTYKRKHG